LKLLVVTGTRPNIVKEYAFNRACQRHGVDEIVVHTGQHYDRRMFKSFLEELGLKEPDYINDLIKSTPTKDLANIMTFLEAVLYQEKPDAVVVYGDVNSTMAAAIVSAKLGIPLAHVESGARSSLLYNPEEINRRVTEVVADTLFAHTREAYQVLIDSGFSSKDVFFTGDIMKDSLLLALKEQDIHISNKSYVLVTIHRAENTDNPKRLKNMVEALVSCKKEIYFPVHPRTENALKRYNLWDSLASAMQINLLPPQSYFNNLKLLAEADRVASDSGGLRREAYMLGKPVVALTDIVWAPEILKAGWKWVANDDVEKIIYGLEKFMPPETRPEIFGQGDAAEKMLEILLRRYGSGKRKSKLSHTGIENVNSLTRASLEKFIDEFPLSKRMREKRKTVSVVIPCYNEEDSLPLLFYRLDHLPNVIDRNRYKLQYVLVNDCSSDKTGEMLRIKYENHSNTVIIDNECNLGIGGAIKRGFDQAGGDIIVTIDADTNYDPLEIPNLLEMMKDDVDIVTASPFKKGGGWNYPFHRFVFSRGVVILYRFVLGKKAGDIQTFSSGFRAYRKEVIGPIRPRADDFLSTTEMLVRALLKGFKVVEYPTVVYERKFGKSKLPTLRTMFSHLVFMKQLLYGHDN